MWQIGNGKNSMETYHVISILDKCSQQRDDNESDKKKTCAQKLVTNNQHKWHRSSAMDEMKSNTRYKCEHNMQTRSDTFEIDTLR